MDLKFGVQLAPSDDRLPLIRRLARPADQEGLDLFGFQDHPYTDSFVDTFALIATVLADTDRLRVFPDVANLPLRGPAMLGKQAASLDLLSGGRFELALGAGAFWRAITAMGGPGRSKVGALRALEEATEIIRAMWRPGETVDVAGDHYSVRGVRAGPAPAHPIGIWFGSVGPKANALTGRIADGWAAPIQNYIPYADIRTAQDTITAAAVDSGRSPQDITRIAQLVGHITPTPGPVNLHTSGPIRTDAAGWARILTDLAVDTGFDTFIFWPEAPDENQIRRWAGDVAPLARSQHT